MIGDQIGLVPTWQTELRYDQAKSALDEAIWQEMGNQLVGNLVTSWLETLSPHTCRNYRSGMTVLQREGIMHAEMSLKAFALVNHNAVVDKIKQHPDWSECTKQARAACYISFTAYLSRRFDGMIKKAVACKEGSNITFYRVYHKVATKAMTQAEWLRFFACIKNKRDCLIAKLILQGGKRVSEVLNLQVDQIDLSKSEITFRQSKTRGEVKYTVITYPASIMQDLRDYIGERSGLVFVTSKTGNQVQLVQLINSFGKAGKMANIPFKVTPHVLRASAVTFLKQAGFADSDIMKITGHASAEMICAYDKSDMAENATKRVNLIN
jgi:integrase